MQVPRRCIRVKREMTRIAARRDHDVILRPKARKFQIGGLPVIDANGLVNGYVAEPLRPGAATQLVNLLTDHAAGA